MEINKVIVVGMSKTGTTTMGKCLEVLGFNPHQGHDRRLKKFLAAGGSSAAVVAEAAKYRSLEDSPWYMVFRELDQQFPGSKFILTMRKDSLTHARSSWYHGVRAGYRRGEPTREYLAEKIRVYEAHNREVLDYFSGRPDDLLAFCLEDGEGWEKLCPFLGVGVPEIPLPHENAGSRPGSAARLSRVFANSASAMIVRRVKHYLSGVDALRKIDRVLNAKNGLLTRSRRCTPGDNVRGLKQV
jgi:hypothetical protein